MKVFCALFVALLLAGSNAQANCIEAMGKVKERLQARQYAEATSALSALKVSADCSAAQISAASRATSEVFVQAAIKAGASSPDYERLLAAAAKDKVIWQAQRLYGDWLVARKRYADASPQYQDALEILARDKVAVSREEKTYILQRADETRELAGTFGNGDGKAAYVAPVAGHRGGAGGVYGEISERGVVAKKVPSPIQFEYDSAKFTPIGQKYAEELLTLLRSYSPASITVTGHTDQRGSDAYNQTLSEKRAAAVAEYLQKNGIAARYTIIGKGKSEPRSLSDTDYSPDEILTLNRRVEFDWK